MSLSIEQNGWVGMGQKPYISSPHRLFHVASCLGLGFRRFRSLYGVLQSPPFAATGGTVRHFEVVPHLFIAPSKWDT